MISKTSWQLGVFVSRNLKFFYQILIFSQMEKISIKREKIQFQNLLNFVKYFFLKIFLINSFFFFPYKKIDHYFCRNLAKTISNNFYLNLKNILYIIEFKIVV
jgi:hypothetical protein